MKIIEFRKITTEDTTDDLYSGFWSRIYEYPLVIQIIDNYYKKSNSIHNTSWGFQGVHLKFKNKLDSIYGDVVHSDIKKSNEKNTFIYDICNPPTSDEKYDFVLNISTLEEIKTKNHIDIFNNLFSMVKDGGFLIATFDLPGLQLEKFEEMFGQSLEFGIEPINGKNSKCPNQQYSHLTCGIMVVQK
jgi:hypothetical protein